LNSEHLNASNPNKSKKAISKADSGKPTNLIQISNAQFTSEERILNLRGNKIRKG
jgi:hypothetical protein